MVAFSWLVLHYVQCIRTYVHTVCNLAPDVTDVIHVRMCSAVCMLLDCVSVA